MRKTLVINSGSSSLKFKLFGMPEYEVLTEGIVDRIGLEEGIVSLKIAGEKHKLETKVSNHEVGIKLMLEQFEQHKIVSELSEITKVGHRVVQGGEIFKKSTLVQDKELEQIKDLAKLAPLHNIPNALGIEVFQKLIPTAQNIAVFDTEFHQSMEPESYIYPLPYEWYEKYNVRRYGAHGTSHKYIANATPKALNKDPKDLKIINCHLGNGASICAIKDGKSIQTSMGMTPLAGIMMGTRSGDIDPSIIEYMCEQTNMTIQEITAILNKKSGMLGLSGISSDFRYIDDAIDEGNEKAIQAMKIYITRIIETIGAYYMRLGGLDVLTFTAGIGENSPQVREGVINGLAKTLGMVLDEEANKVRGKEAIITKPESKVIAMVLPTEEEYQIALEAERF